jgi:hypothetical protein
MYTLHQKGLGGFRTVNSKGGKSMKKFLSLVLALVMTMSLVTISAGAKGFTDSSKVDYEDAVEVMQALGVIDGYTDGSFRPQTALNRGQAAKIICNMILGPTTAAALPVSSAPFSDVPVDNVFAGYIAYCAKEGIINGYTDGTFRPTAQLTGYAFMKMLLGALGYDAEIEGYTGVANWGVNVAKQALGIGLADGNDNFVGTNTVTREEACLYAFNTLSAVMVKYGNKTTVTIGDSTITVGAGEATEVENNDTNETFKDDDKLNFAEKYFTDLTTEETVNDYGRPADKWTLKKTEIGTFAKKADKSYTVSVEGGDIYSALGKSSIDEVVTVYNVLDGEPFDDDDGNDEFDVVKKGEDSIGGNGLLTEVYYLEDVSDELADAYGIGSGDDAVIIVVTATYAAQVDGDYDEDDEELDITLLNEEDDYPVSSDDVSGLSAFEDEDYVLVTFATFDLDEPYVGTVKATEKVTGTVTKYVEDTSVTAGGTTRKYAWVYNEEEGPDDYELNEDYDLIVDENDFVLYTDGADGVKNYVFVDEIAQDGVLSRSKWVSGAYFTDGTYDEVTLKKVGSISSSDLGDEFDPDGTTVNAWYTYTEKDGKYTLKIVDNQKASGTVTAGLPVINSDNGKNGNIIKVDNTQTTIGTKTTVFVTLDKDDNIKTYTGIKNAPAITAAADTAVYVSENSSGYAEYVFIDLGHGKTTGNSSSEDLIFVYKVAVKTTHEDGNDYYVLDAVVGGKTTKVNVDVDADGLVGTAYDDETGSMTKTVQGALYTDVVYDSNGYVTSLTLVTDGYDDDILVFDDVDAITQKSNAITLDGTKIYMDDDATIRVLDKSDKKVTTTTAKALVNKYGEDGVDAAYAVMDDGYCTVLYVVVP